MRLGRGKRFYAGGKVAVGAEVSGDEAADFGEDSFEVEVVECADHAFGLVALEDADLAAGRRMRWSSARPSS